MVDLGPDWVVAEMPPGYQNRVAEIQRLTADLHEMSRFGRLLREVGPGLAEAVCGVFAALKFEASTDLGPDGTGVVVKLDGQRRLLMHMSGEEQTIEKKNAELARVFQMLHEFADEHDRVVFVTNNEPGKRPTDRAESLAREALTLLGRMGAVHVPASTLFTLWKLSLLDADRARAQVQGLYAQEGGSFQIPASAFR
jgi:hypothetical protein